MAWVAWGAFIIGMSVMALIVFVCGQNRTASASASADQRFEAQACTREDGHDGPCNGLPCRCPAQFAGRRCTRARHPRLFDSPHRSGLLSWEDEPLRCLDPE